MVIDIWGHFPGGGMVVMRGGGGGYCPAGNWMGGGGGGDCPCSFRMRNTSVRTRPFPVEAKTSLKSKS